MTVKELIKETEGKYTDYQEVVRCKDCKHVEYTPASSWARPYVCRIVSKGLGYCPDDGNGFCPYGERKEGDEE